MGYTNTQKKNIGSSEYLSINVITSFYSLMILQLKKGSQ